MATSSRVLAAAAYLFREKGYSGATTRDIAEAAGLQKASLYHYIQGKEQLLYQICMESLAHIHGTVALMVAREDDPLRRLRAAIVGHVTAMLDDQDKHTCMLVDLRSLTGERRQEVIARRDAYEEILEAILRECQRLGCIRQDWDSGQLVLALLNLLNWTIFWYRPGGDMTPEKIAELLQTIYLEGVRQRASTATPVDVGLATLARRASQRGRPARVS